MVEFAVQGTKPRARLGQGWVFLFLTHVRYGESGEVGSAYPASGIHRLFLVAILHTGGLKSANSKQYLP